MSAERPKRYAPKRVHPDFIQYTSTSSQHLFAFTTSPRKKLTQSQNELPSPKSIHLNKANHQNSSIAPLVYNNDSITKSDDTADSKPSNGISNASDCPRSSLVLSKSVSDSNKNGCALTRPCGEKRIKLMRSAQKMNKSKKSLSGSCKVYRVKECEKTACTSSAPICFAGCSSDCTGNGYTSRWNHFSDGEHFCNSCFENAYRSYKNGYEEYLKWKHVWSINGQSEPSVKNFMADQKLPYWLQCNKCKKWRQLSCKLNITPEFILHYQCGQNLQGVKKGLSNDCEHDEDERVAAVGTDEWLQRLNYQCLLQQSPAAPLMRSYYQDCVGLSPSYNKRECASNSLEDETEFVPDAGEMKMHLVKPSTALQKIGIKLPSWSKPFVDNDDDDIAWCFSPSRMTADELKAFPEYKRMQPVYLAIRNLVVTLWNMDCKNPVTTESCQHHLICRGLIRVRCVQELGRVIQFLSLHGYVNTGFINQLPKELHPPKVEQLRVIVIGGGSAGISAASHLHKFGAQVTILEAKDHIGGRCHDNMSLGLCIGEGAQIINCPDNNPLTILCDQVSAAMQQISDKCDLYQENGQITLSAVDRRIDFHFNAMLDNVAEWRKDKTEKDDMNLMDKINEMHKEFKEESSLDFSDEEEKLLQFHCGNLEYACGASLDKISALYWDQNENYPQFSGYPCFVKDGFDKVFSKLAEGLDIKFKTQVTKIDYAGDEVTVWAANGCSYHGQRVVITVPLAVLQKGMIEFNPALPEKKIRAIHMLGAGQVEKVALQFPHPFWIKKTKGADFFGHIPESEVDRGEFGVFYHIRPKNVMEGPFILLTHICGKALHKMTEKTDKEIVTECVKVLEKLFPEEQIPDPINFLVTRWKDDPLISMAYVHIAVGCSGEVFDDLAEMVDEKLHFAGEATNRQFPQSVTGAYLSGIREAYLVLTGLELDLGSEDKDAVMKKVQNRLDNSAGKEELPNGMEQNNDIDVNRNAVEQSCDQVSNTSLHS